MSNFQRKDVREMSIKELEDYIQKNSEQNSRNILSKDIFETNRKSENYSNCLSYNCIDSKRNSSDRDIKEYKFEEIYHLIKENIELKSDLKQLFFLTDQNKNELENTIKELSEENFNLKNQINELKERLMFQQNIISTSKENQSKFENEKNIMKENYENEISLYKNKLNDLSFEYQTLLNNYNQLSQQSLYYQNIKTVKNVFEDQNKQSTIEEVRNLKEYLLTNNNNIQEIKDKLNEMEQKSNFDLNKSNRSFKRSNILNSYKNLRTSNSISKVKINNPNKNKSNKRINNNSNKPKKLIITNSNNSPNKYMNNFNNSEINNILQFIEEEIFSLERKIAELNISYQSFLNKFKNENESQELKQTLKFLKDSINSKNQKLKELKLKQQQYLFETTMNN